MRARRDAAVARVEWRSLVLALTCACAISIGAMPDGVRAHGRDGDGPVWTEHAVGPYRVTLWADLHVPATFVYARVEAAGSAPRDTRMTISGRGPQGERSEAVAEALAGAAGAAGDREALLPVPVPGRWRITVHLDGKAGAAEETFVRMARTESSEQWARAPFLLVTLFLTGVAILARSRASRVASARARALEPHG